MAEKKQGRKRLKLPKRDPLDPKVLTLDEALALADNWFEGNESERASAESEAKVALLDRIGCRFTGPSNFGNLTRGEQMVVELSGLESEVLNGGFHQYLSNSSGETADEAVQHLEMIGAVETLKLMRRLLQIFPNGRVPKDQDKRDNLLCKWEAKAGERWFDELSLKFYRQQESLPRLMLAYVQTHRDEFAEPADEIVRKLKRQRPICQYLLGDATPEWLKGADEALRVLTEMAKKVEADQKSNPSRRKNSR